MHILTALARICRKLPRKLSYFFLAGIAITLLLWAYEFVIGFPRNTDGQWVQRRTRWHGLGMGRPLPYQRGMMYHFYTNHQGQEVRHGEFRDLHGNGVLASLSNYRHGKFHGTSTRWNEKGEKTNEQIFEDGKQIGWSIHSGGQLEYHNEEIFENGILIAWRRFESGRWFLQIPVNRTPRLEINPLTGVLSPLE